MSESSEYLNVTRRVLWEHGVTGEQGRAIEHVTVDGEQAQVEYRGLTNMIPASTLTSVSPDVMRWELAKYLAAQNHAAREREIPECERRAVSRGIRQQRQAAHIATVACPACSNTGWVDDLGDGTSGTCPACLDPDRGMPAD